MTDHSTRSGDATARIIMVRHGESEWNVLGKWQGRADTKLTDAGRSQARVAALSIAKSGITIHRVVASSLSRAHETAEIVARTLGLAAPEVDDRLVETDVGPFCASTRSKRENSGRASRSSLRHRRNERSDIRALTSVSGTERAAAAMIVFGQISLSVRIAMSGRQ